MSELAFTNITIWLDVDYHHFNIYLNYWRCDSLQKKKLKSLQKNLFDKQELLLEHITKLSYRVPNPKTYLSLCTDSITYAKRNTAKTTTQSTLKYITDTRIPLISE